MKIVKNNFTAFQTDIEVYAALSDTTHMPSFHGAFHGVYEGQSVGIIVIDLLASMFKRANDMTADQK